MRRWGYLIVVFGALFLSCNSPIEPDSSGSESEHTVSSQRQDGYFFTNPLLDCEPELQYLPPFKSELDTLINKAIRTKNAKRVSVYFRQLNSGYSFGINELQNYTPSSLLKVAEMMYVLQEIQKNPQLKNLKLQYTSTQSIQDSIDGFKSNLEIGKDYSLTELLSEMMVFSDNEARSVILEGLEKTRLWKDVFSELGIHIKTGSGKTNIISPKQYSTLFRVLYNSSFLDEESSQFALDLLCRSKFDAGIRAGIPNSSINVASKFGFKKKPASVQLHETGIVYVGNRPYLLCIMTEGDNSDNLSSVIRQISNFIYLKNVDIYENAEVKTLERKPDYEKTLLSPLIDCGNNEINELEPLYQKVKTYVDVETSKPEIDYVSVLFKHLVNGRTFGINRNVRFNAASLMKVPLMMSILKEGERNPDLLDQKITYTPDLKVMNPNIVDYQIEVDKEYSIKELVKRSIIFSDNAATVLLSLQDTTDVRIKSLYKDLSIDETSEPYGIGKGLATMEEISLLFRVLYNATYLNRRNSEVALKYLSRTRFNEGLRRDLPSDVLVASKFGERKTTYRLGTELELHDCGIIYFEDNPYILCVATKGKDFSSQANTIAGISKLIFEEIKLQTPTVSN